MTRSDFDGLVCAALLKHLGMLDDILFVSPKDVQDGKVATGKSILDRSSRTNVGELMLSYGGGGHEAAGTCQVENEDAPRVLGELIERINADG